MVNENLIYSSIGHEMFPKCFDYKIPTTLYRGQSKNWDLLPSGYRQNYTSKYHYNPKLASKHIDFNLICGSFYECCTHILESKYHFDQYCKDNKLMETLYTYCERYSISNMDIRNIRNDFIINVFSQWRVDNIEGQDLILDVFAIFQHGGLSNNGMLNSSLPTPFLDWTEKREIAEHFAKTESPDDYYIYELDFLVYLLWYNNEFYKIDETMERLLINDTLKYYKIISYHDEIERNNKNIQNQNGWLMFIEPIVLNGKPQPLNNYTILNSLIKNYHYVNGKKIEEQSHE